MFFYPSSAIRSPIRVFDLDHDERTVLGSFAIACSLYTVADLCTPQSDRRGKTTGQKLFDFSVFTALGFFIFKTAKLDYVLYTFTN